MRIKTQELLCQEPFADPVPDLMQGELYLFHRTSRDCPARTSLWGIFDRAEGREIYLESSTPDLREFRFWHRLPPRYRYCRTATRPELRDYIATLTYWECMRQERTHRLLRPAMVR